jgi:hypothetical protein
VSELEILHMTQLEAFGLGIAVGLALAIIMVGVMYRLIWGKRRAK